ncbi:Rho GTPase-activating protein SYDE2 [Takifugu flavidus]|uniref:Rho GTPase-activating protein SYDE2 n=1 Tax=Takifugu flavidus TaxID=433684 RepID=A0A5C6MV52_9TELE|nr:Rho GTPase-activating protein SYDE2 [Takifugu flavidus]
MADPLRRTLLAKLRGKKSKKGATVGGGYGSTPAAAAVTGSREGKEKVLQTQRDSGEAGQVVVLHELDYASERMSTYENCVDGTAVPTGGVVIVRPGRAAESVGARLQERSSGGRVQVNEELPGVSLQRAVQFGGRVIGEGEISYQGPGSGKRTLPAGLTHDGAHVHRKLFVSVPRQCRVGDSIGFGDSSSDVLCRTRVEMHAGSGPAAESDVTELRDRGQSRHMAATGPCVSERNTNWGLDSSCQRTSASLYPNSDKNIVNRNAEGCEQGGEVRGLGAPQSPTFFPTELDICDIEVDSPRVTAESLRYTLNSEDEDYYDNEILPFYKAKRDGKRAAPGKQPLSGQDVGQAEESNTAQETDRLRNQLKEAYYLLISAMNDINLDVQQISCGLTEQQATSSCSSHSRDSLCSRLSIKNMDSDSWSSGGEHSPQQVSDADSLLLCLSGNTESGFKDCSSKSKSAENLSTVTVRPPLLRSASDGAIRYTGGPPLCVRVSEVQGPEIFGDAADAEAEASEEPPAYYEAVSGDEVLQEPGRDEERGEQLNESSGSVNSLTGSSDSNADATAHRGHGNKQKQSKGREERSHSIRKGHGVTVNKMQEWMHKGRMLSSEMKQRIEGSALPPQANLCGCKAGSQSAGQRVKPVKAKSPPIKSPQLQQPAFIENVQTPCANGQPGESHPTWRQPLTTITVSKKRNWLQQSSLGRNHCSKDELPGLLGAEEEGSQGSHQPPPCPCPDQIRISATVTRPARLHLPQVNICQSKESAQFRSVDPAEENDADDEGEIWYNPIPEDEEPEVSHRPSVRLLVPSRVAPQRRPSRGGDVGHLLEVPGENLGSGGSGDGSQGNGANSAETLLLHRQMLVCKPQEEGGASRAADVSDLPNGVTSPPSSPNPAKKSSSINWSFPDRIKSPRTVRKISMKMKKLPELSRKLSVKGTPSSSNSGNSQLEPRAHSPRNNGSSSEAIPHSSGPPRLAASGAGSASRNVISRYHLDSSVSTQHSFNKKKNNGSSKSASKGGYLSDGDSPELVAKSGKHSSAEGKAGKVKDPEGGVPSSKLSGTELDIDAFRHYSFTEQPKCSQYISGLMSLHFYGAEDLKPPRVDSRDVYCAIQVDSVNKARTALLTCRTTFLDMDHTFNIDLENAQHLKLVVFSWEPTPRRNRVCCHGTVVLPALFRVTRCHQLAVKLEPRGLIYVKLSLMEQWQNSLDGGPDGDREPQVFGVEAWRAVERENTGLMVPLLISKCINEIEKRGCQVVGLYRLCGSAAVKKELREAFERDSYAVELCENMYPDVNVITGVLKDYLRELPYPLISKNLYEAVLESMTTRPLRIGVAGCENDQADSEHTMTLRRLLDHLKLVASYQEVNKMTCQNLAVCFGPVLLSQRQEASCHTNRVFIDSEELASALHFKKHIEVLHYLLQLWPVVDPSGQSSSCSSSSSSSHLPAAFLAQASSDMVSAPPLRRRKERPQVLNLSTVDMAGVLRPRPGRLDSPSNRYAGDWSECGESYFPSELLLPPSKEEADYDDVPCEDAEAAEERQHEPESVEAEEGQTVPCPAPDPEQQGEEPANEDKEEEEKAVESDSSGSVQPTEERDEDERVCEHILPPRLPKEHTYQAYVKIQDISPVLSNRVNLKDLQESIDTLIGNLERELNKNKLNVGY